MTWEAMIDWALGIPFLSLTFLFVALTEFFLSSWEVLEGVHVTLSNTRSIVVDSQLNDIQYFSSRTPDHESSSATRELDQSFVNSFLFSCSRRT